MNAREVIMRKHAFGRIVFVCALLTFIVSSPPFLLGAERKYGGTLRIGVRAQQESNIDVRYPHTIPMVPATELLYDRLFTWGDKGLESLIPAIAQGYQTRDNRVWTINLRKD